MVYGLGLVVHGLWFRVYEHWYMARRLLFIVHSACCMAYVLHFVFDLDGLPSVVYVNGMRFLWSPVYGLRIMVCYLCFTVCGLLHFVYSIWLKVYGVWLVVYVLCFVHHGLWFRLCGSAVVYGLGFFGSLYAVYGLWFLICRFMAHCVWCMVYGLWLVGCGLQCVAYGLWCVVYSFRLWAYGSWCMV